MKLLLGSAHVYAKGMTPSGRQHKAAPQRVVELQAELVVLGGAFYVNGNVNPAAEANIYGDPDAADYVFGKSDKVRVVGLDVTHQCIITTAQVEQLKGKGLYGSFIHSITQFYLKYHR